MKIIVFILSFFSHLAYSQADLLKSGNTFFSKAMYKEAIDAYQQVESASLGGFGLYGNMARSYSYLGQDPLAILYFEKALTLKPNDEQIIKDLNNIRRRTPDIDVPPDPFFGKQMWNTITGLFLPGIWAAISLLTLTLVGLLFSWRSLTTFKDKKLLPSILALSFILLFSLLAAYYRDQQIYHNKALIITTGNTTLKAGPDQLSPDISELPAGTKVYKKDFLGMWTQVTNEYGDIGWIKTTAARSI